MCVYIRLCASDAQSNYIVFGLPYSSIVTVFAMDFGFMGGGMGPDCAGVPLNTSFSSIGQRLLQLMVDDQFSPISQV